MKTNWTGSNEKIFGNPDLLNLNKKKKKLLSSMRKWDDESIVGTNKEARFRTKAIHANATSRCLIIKIKA